MTLSFFCYANQSDSRLARNVPLHVTPALLKAGLDAASIPAFLAAVAVDPSGDFTTLSGVTPSIAQIGLRAYQEAALSSYGTVWLTTISLSALSIGFSFFAPNVNHLLTSDVNAPIHDRNGEKVAEAKGSSKEVESV